MRANIRQECCAEECVWCDFQLICLLDKNSIWNWVEWKVALKREGKGALTWCLPCLAHKLIKNPPNLYMQINLLEFFLLKAL